MIKKIALLIISAICLSCSSEPQTIGKDFNYDWCFRMGEMESNFQNESCSDCCKSEWQSVNIPHDWSIQDGYTEQNTAGSNGFLPGGVGWYKKVFTLPKSYEGKNIAVRFEGVYNNAQVWINGHDLGNFPNGYLDFEYDLTPHITQGDNTIVVRVDRRAYADARWYVGGGIYRPVHLIARDNIYMPSHAQKITTPAVSAESATVKITTDIESKYATPEELSVAYKIIFDGKTVAESSSQHTIGAKSQITAEVKLQISNPQLWSLQSPQRYELLTTIKQGDKVVDERNDHFGVKSAIFDPNKGFLLNGEEVKIKGVNIHHDLGCLGVALYDKALYRRLKKMKDMGVNAIRTAHNPHSESLLTMCDTMGLLVMNEFIDEWRAVKGKWIVQRSMSGIADSLQNGYPRHFDEWAERDIKAFVRRDYNHPSIILWSIGNEIEWAYSYYYKSIANTGSYHGLVFDDSYNKNLKAIADTFYKLAGGEDEELARTAKELAQWVRDVDTTRPITSGVAIPVVSRISGYIDALDVIGYNYKDTAYENDHKIHHDKSIIGSENVGQYFEWKAVLDKPYIPGIFVWTGVDYIGENGPWPAKGGTYSFFDFACFKTSRGEFFETLWSDAPKTHIVTTPASLSEFKQQADGSFEIVYRKDPLRKWQWFDTFDKWSYESGEQIVVQVYTNAPKAELKLNGKSLGVKSLESDAVENVLVWQLPYAEGEITAIGLNESGKELSRYSLATAGELSQLYVTSDSKCIASDGFDLANIEVEMQDSKGTLVSDAPQIITVTTDSKTVILGVDNGSDTFVGDHQSNTIVTNNGRALVVVQPVRDAKGSSTITLSSESGATQSITLNYR